MTYFTKILLKRLLSITCKINFKCSATEMLRKKPRGTKHGSCTLKKTKCHHAMTKPQDGYSFSRNFHTHPHHVVFAVTLGQAGAVTWRLTPRGEMVASGRKNISLASLFFMAGSTYCSTS